LSYDIEVAGPARRALTDELAVAVAAAAWELIAGPLRDNPQRLGKPLRAPFAGHWVARRNSYRVRYRIDEERHVVTILDVRGRADAYRTWVGR
jgi:mRNA interferase RelE/StbE